jgi:hypothetical protein
MSEEDLQLLITLDDPGEPPEEEDIFSHLQTQNGLEYWLSQQPNKQFDVEVCTITHWRQGKIVEQKVFYALEGMAVQENSL